MKHGLIDRRDFEDWLIENCTGNMAQLVKGYIKEQPIVDAVPVVHGHWEIVPDDYNMDGYYKMRCSVCGETLWSVQSEELYCCKCGAKMDGDANKNE